MKRGISFRLSEDAITLIKTIATDTGLSEAAVLELAVRDLAKARDLLKTQISETEKPPESS